MRQILLEWFGYCCPCFSSDIEGFLSWEVLPKVQNETGVYNALFVNTRQKTTEPLEAGVQK